MCYIQNTKSYREKNPRQTWNGIYQTRSHLMQNQYNNKKESARGFTQRHISASISVSDPMWVFSIWPIIIAHLQQYDLSHFIIITICHLPHWLRFQLFDCNHINLNYDKEWERNDEKQMLYPTKCQSKEEKKALMGGDFWPLNDIFVWLKQIKCKILLEHVHVCESRCSLQISTNEANEEHSHGHESPLVCIPEGAIDDGYFLFFCCTCSFAYIDKWMELIALSVFSSSTKHFSEISTIQLRWRVRFHSHDRQIQKNTGLFQS